MRKILSIDGGGIRGIFAVAYLAHLEDDLQYPLHEYFDLIAGTSTGGIIAIGLAMGVKARDILGFYESRGPEIFLQHRKKLAARATRIVRGVRWALWGPKYSPTPLKRALTDILGEQKIGAAKTRLLVPAWHPQTGTPYIFKTAHHERLRTDYKELAVDAAMATAAAPTYYPMSTTSPGVGLVDGGIWANNPTGIAVAEGIGTLKWQGSQIKVLSIGCLENMIEISSTYSLLQFLQKSPDLFIASQSQMSISIAKTLLGDVGGANHKALYRVSQSAPNGSFSLDGTQKIPALKSRAYEQARKDKSDLLNIFFNETKEPFQPVYRC